MLMILTSAGVDPNSRAHEHLHTRIECVALDKRKPRQFISYEGVDHKAWDGRKHVRGAVLRLRNNSDCAILLVTPPGVAPRLIKKNGKYVWQNDWDTPQLRNDSHIDVVYKLHFPRLNRSETPVPSGDVILKSKLASGESIVFSVPVKFLKQGAELELAFNYESVPNTESIYFSSSQLPKIAMK